MPLVQESPYSLKVPESLVTNAPFSLLDARRKVEKIRRMRLPYGQELFSKVIETYRPLTDPLVEISLRHRNALVQSVEKAYRLFEGCSRWTPLQWVQKHIEIRSTMIEIISLNTQTFYYTMGEAEIERWINEVFHCIKRVAGTLFRIQPSPQEHLQTVVDSSFRLVQLMNKEACKQERFHEYYSYLLYLCQRTCLAPSTYLLNPTDVAIDQSDSIGCGATSDIYRCVVNGKEAAAKNYRIYKGIKKRDKRTFLKEALLLRLIPHPHILPSFGVIMSDDALQIISPWMKNGDIVKYTKSHPNVSKKELVEQVADGLHFLHQYNIVHGDLKGANILINDDGRACIADLGASTFMSASPRGAISCKATSNLYSHPSYSLAETVQNCSTISNATAFSSLSGMSVFSGAGTLRYMSPERLLPEKHGEESARATPSSDIFSFGMLVWEVYTGEVPFPEIKLQDYAAQKILLGQRPPKPAIMSPELWRLVESCWKKWPNTRPTIHQIYNALATMP